MKDNYLNAFAEVYFIIMCLSEEEQKKISPNFIQFLHDNKNNDYKVTINPNKSLISQNLLKETRELLREIYLSYFVSKEQRYDILLTEKYNKN